MSNQHLISIQREAHLSVDTGRLKIFFPSCEEVHYIALSDIAIVIAAHAQISFSISAQRELAKNGALLVIADDKFMPCALSLPLGVNIDGAKRPHLQAKFANSQEKDMWWKQIIQAKIAGQAKAAKRFDEALCGKLLHISKNVLNGDKDYREAQAAQAYWPAYMSTLGNSVLCRDKQGAADCINISLNYGYAVLRAIIARSLAAAGLCLNLGVGHRRKDNPFNLADDFIEPFRFLCDMAVFDIFARFCHREFNSEIKKQLLETLLKTSVEISGREYRLFQAVDYSVNSFCLSLDDPRRKLQLPNQSVRRGKKAAEIELPIQFEYET